MGSIYFGETHSLVEFIKKVFRRSNLDFEKYVKNNKNLYRSIDIQINYGDNSESKNSSTYSDNYHYRPCIYLIIFKYSDCKYSEI